MYQIALFLLGASLFLFPHAGAGVTAAPLAQLQSPAPAPKTVTVEMYEVGPDKWIFEPASVTVNAGDTVLWKNTDRVAHTSTSDDRLWDSDALDPGESYSFTFRKTGKYGYFCAYHAGMAGEVVVVAAPVPTATAKPTDTPEPTATPTPTDTPRPAPTRTPRPTVKPRPSPTPTMSPTEVPSPTVRPTSAPTATVELTATPEPTPTEIAAPAVTPMQPPSTDGAEGDNRGAGLAYALGGALLIAAGAFAYRLLQN